MSTIELRFNSDIPEPDGGRGGGLPSTLSSSSESSTTFLPPIVHSLDDEWGVNARGDAKLCDTRDLAWDLNVHVAR